MKRIIEIKKDTTLLDIFNNVNCPFDLNNCFTSENCYEIVIYDYKLRKRRCIIKP